MKNQLGTIRCLNITIAASDMIDYMTKLIAEYAKFPNNIIIGGGAWENALHTVYIGYSAPGSIIVLMVPRSHVNMYVGYRWDNVNHIDSIRLSAV